MYTSLKIFYGRITILGTHVFKNISLVNSDSSSPFFSKRMLSRCRISGFIIEIET